MTERLLIILWWALMIGGGFLSCISFCILLCVCSPKSLLLRKVKDPVAKLLIEAGGPKVDDAIMTVRIAYLGGLIKALSITGLCFGMAWVIA